MLLALRASPRRDELLRRSFAFVEEMLATEDADVSGLAWIGLFEGRSLRLDGHGVRALIAEELRAEGVTLSGVPGTSYAADPEPD